MTDTEIRIAIAEACPEIAHVNRALNQAFWNDKNNVEFDPINDLNAMAEARKTLTTDTQRSRYFEALHQVVGPIGDNPQWAMIDATANQHAEAFLKTIGEWKGEGL